MKIKEFIIATMLIICLLVVYGFFPSKNTFQQLTIMVTFFIIIPIIFNKVILKNKLNDISFGIGSWKQGLIWGGISLLATGAIFFIASYFFDFLIHYPIPASITHNYKKFIFYEFTLVLPVIFIYDFFFRGFAMSILDKKTAYWSIIIQALLFFILVVATNSLNWTILPYLISAPLAGLVVYKSRSIFYATTFQFIAIMILDANIVRLIK